MSQLHFSHDHNGIIELVLPERMGDQCGSQALAPIISRDAYLTSNLGRARANIAAACRTIRKLDAQLHDVGTALTRGDGEIRAAEDTAETVRDLRILCADLETFVRLHLAEGGR